MADTMVENPVVAQGEQPVNGWSAGVFAETGTQLPAPCLRHCLGGDHKQAESHGCPIIQAMIERRRSSPVNLRPAAPALCNRGYGVKLMLSDLTGAPDVLVLRHPPECSEAEPAFKAVAVENWRLGQENEGLANELLRSYEQINLIFDISAQIAVRTDADEIRYMLLDKLRHLFDADKVLFVCPDSGVAKEVIRSSEHPSQPTRFDPLSGAFARQRPCLELPAEFPRVLEQFAQSKRVLVSSEGSLPDENGMGTSMWGPLSDGSGDYAIVGIIRRQNRFVAGDMLLMDSVLTYGGNILSNLRLVDQLKRTSFESVRALVNAIDQKDNYTCGHSERVGFLAKATGQYVGLSVEQQQELEWAGLLHDVGKIGIPERVLNKPGALTAEEFALIREHPSRSYEVLRPVASLEPVLDGVLYHHEAPDGSGYPSGLKGDEIPLIARIVHVVDVFDALTSTRSYRKAFNANKAFDIIRHDAGTKLDATVVEQFMRMWGVLPKTHPEKFQKFWGPHGSVPLTTTDKDDTASVPAASETRPVTEAAS
jgi:HD-GYP domain-containing protein (c-di-GMP phosphodiesterase class II)